MAQFKIYGHKAFLDGRTDAISGALHNAATAGLGLPQGKRFHRFISLDEGYFLTPDDRSERYLIIECILFEGRSLQTKKAFYEILLQEMSSVGVIAQDLEFTFVETPRHDWLIRGTPGDALIPGYAVEM